MQLYNALCPCGCFDSFEDQEVGLLKEFSHWFLILNWEQGFLGRSLLILKSHKTDEIELTKAEVLEKHKAYGKWHAAVSQAFHPDKINQAQLGNEEYLHRGHLHWHFVPRYRRPIKFAGLAFPYDTPETQRLDYALLRKRIVYPRDARKKIQKELQRFL